MALGIPDLTGVIEATKDMPEQFEALVQRLDRVVELLEEQNEIQRGGTSVYDVKFHFPYANIILEKIPGWKVDGWTTYIRSGKVFAAQGAQGTTEYIINTSMLTYMEVNEHKEF